MAKTRTVFAAAGLLLAANAFAATEPLLEVERHTVQSALLGEKREVLVSTPAAYGRGEQRYPVLYLTDGPAHIAHARTTVDFLAGNGLMPQLVIVGIPNTDRTRDLTPTRGQVHDGQRWVELPTSGGADRFLAFVETELAPFVERTYRTEPLRVYAGHSFGGLLGIHALFARPDLFGAVIAASPTVTWDDQLLLREGRQFFTNGRKVDRVLFLTTGNEGAANQAAFEAFVSLLEKQGSKGLRWGSQVLPDDDHSSHVLVTYHQGLRKVFEGWAPPRDRASRRFVGSLSGVRAHYEKLSARFGYPVKPPEAVVNLVGYQELADGKVEDAIAVFRANVELYPGSANVHDSLGEALERAGRLPEALESYARASEIGARTGDPNAAVFKRNHQRLLEKAGAGAPD